MKMIGYKGFDKDMKCRDFQFEVGKTYEYDGVIELCRSGFHFCENPLDIFNYYPPAGSKFAEIEAEEVSPETEDDSKRCSIKITVKAEIGFNAVISGAIKFCFDRADWSKKENHSTGTRGAASSTGDYGAASSTGTRGAASSTGEESVAVSIGSEGRAKASLGSFIVLAEWVRGHRVSVKSVLVEGKKIKADTFYTLKNGKFVKA